MPAISVILPIVLQLLELAPQLVTGGQAFIAAAQSIWETATSNVAATADEQAQYDAALEASHAAFQASANRQDPTA
jgi:hypothetical protein